MSYSSKHRGLSHAIFMHCRHGRQAQQKGMKSASGLRRSGGDMRTTSSDSGWTALKCATHVNSSCFACCLCMASLSMCSPFSVSQQCSPELGQLQNGMLLSSTLHADCKAYGRFLVPICDLVCRQERPRQPDVALPHILAYQIGYCCTSIVVHSVGLRKRRCALQEHRLVSAQQAQHEYEKRKKKFKPTGETVFNQKAVYNAYERRSESVPYTQVSPFVLLWTCTSEQHRTSTALWWRYCERVWE